MKKVFPLILVLTLVLLAACGGGDSTEEPTPSPTPTVTEEPTPTPDEPTPTPTQTQSPTPTVPSGSDVADVVGSIADLVIAYSESDGNWHGYLPANISPLTQLEKGMSYWIFSATEHKPVASGFTVTLNKGWYKGMTRGWETKDEPVTTALQKDKDTILFVIGYDNDAKEFTAYMSPSVAPLTTIEPGQEYCTFTGHSSADTFPTHDINCKTL